MRTVKAKCRGQILLARAMIEHGDCPTEAARRAGCEPSTIYRILTGDTGAGLQTAAKIQAVYPAVLVMSWAERVKGENVPAVPRGKPGKAAKEAA